METRKQTCSYRGSNSFNFPYSDPTLLGSFGSPQSSYRRGKESTEVAQ